MWFIRGDWCGIFCAVMTWVVVLYVDYVTVAQILYPWWKDAADRRPYQMHVTGFHCVIALILVSHFRAMTTDPGAVKSVP